MSLREQFTLPLLGSNGPLNSIDKRLPEMKVLETLVLLKKVDAENNLLNGNFVEIDLRINGKYFLKPKIN